MHQKLLLANILKFTNKSPLEKLHFWAYCDIWYGNSVKLAAYFKLLLS